MKINISRRTKWIMITVAVALLVGVAVVALGKVTLGFQNWDTDDWSLRQNNPDNLYHSATFLAADGVVANGSDGISIKVDEDDHTIRVKGTAEVDKEYAVALVNLKSGTTYAFDGSLDNGTNKTYYMVLEDTSGNVLATSYSGPMLFTVSGDTQAHIKIVIKADASVNTTLKPILCVTDDVDELVDYFK